MACCGQGKNPDPPAELPAWVERYAARRYGADIPAAKRAWEIIVPTFYTGTGEHGTSIRAWPPSVATATPAAYNARSGKHFRAPWPHVCTAKVCPDDELCPWCSAAPAALRLLLEAAASVPESGKSGIEYDLVMLGFEWMQTLFEVRQRSFSVGI